MSRLGKQIIVFSMVWVLLVMALTQIYDNVTGRGLAPKKSVEVPTAAPSAPDQDVARLAELQTCVATNPDNLQCNMELADLYYAAKQWPQAQVNYERAARLQPGNGAILRRLAGTYIYQNDLGRAASTLREAAQAQPDSAETHLLLGLVLSRLDPPQTEAALAEWRKAIEVAPGSESAKQAQQYLDEAAK
jgi:Tfp pilus assembly protein PilF